MVWLRPDLLRRAPRTLDTVLFDVDGVLIETTRSYRLAVIHATDRLVRVFHGLDEAPDPLLTLEDIAAFKLAGGFNSDWDLTQALTALWTARLREWRGQPAADLSVREWAARASEAARAGHGGTAWVRATFPASAIPSDEVARWACDEFYWGAALVRELFGRAAEYAPEATGFVHNETLLLPKDLLPALAGAGVKHLGLITGRLGPEVGWAVRQLAAGCTPDPAADADAPPFGWFDGPYGRSPFAVVVSADLLVKPDPRALTYAAREVGAVGGVYVGDTADDLDLVLRYRAEPQPSDPALPPFLAVMVASGPEAEAYAARGADAVIAHVGELPEVLAALRQSDSGWREPAAREEGSLGTSDSGIDGAEHVVPRATVALAAAGPTTREKGRIMDWKLELVVIPVSDVDRAKAFYTEKVGFHADHDQRVSEGLRFVQLTPPGSACSIALGEGIVDGPPGSVKGLQMVVADINAAHAQLVERGVEVSEVQHLAWGSFVFFSDPDGNHWSVQQLPVRS